jgi:hypothetical protein
VPAVFLLAEGTGLINHFSALHWLCLRPLSRHRFPRAKTTTKMSDLNLVVIVVLTIATAWILISGYNQFRDK